MLQPALKWPDEGGSPGPLWSWIQEGAHPVLPATGVSPRAIADICLRRAERVRLRPFTPHDLRRTAVSNMLDAGIDLVTVQKKAGPASPATTSRYDRRGEETKQKAAEELVVVYPRSRARATVLAAWRGLRDATDLCRALTVS